MNRRRFIGSGVGTAAMAVLTARSGPAAAASPSVIKPKRLAAGDTVGIVAPASATFNTVDLQIARESLEALGLKVQVGGHVLDRHGYLAGQDSRSRCRHQPFLRRSGSARGAAIARRLGRQPAAAVPRLRRHPPQPEDRARLQRHHRAPHGDRRQDRPDHLPRPERHGTLGRVLGELGAGAYCSTARPSRWKTCTTRGNSWSRPRTAYRPSRRAPRAAASWAAISPC